MTPETIQYLMNNGLAVAILIAVGWVSWRVGNAAYKGIIWFGNNFITPIKDAGVEHLKSTDVTLKSISASMELQSVTLIKLSENVEKLTDSYETMINDSATDRTQIHKRIDELDSKITTSGR